jgi:twinkle protein
MVVHSMAKLDLHRHGQPGYFSLAELPQGGSVEKTALGTGWWELDQIFKTYPGQFVVVTGIAGHGKSTLLLNVIVNMAIAHGLRSFLYVPENEGHIRGKLRKIHPGTDAEFKVFSENYCFLQSALPDRYDSATKTLQWVLDKAIVAIEQDHVGLVMIDPWNELERARPPSMMMTDYIGECLMWLKSFARHYGVTVVIVAHPTKQGVNDGKTPTLADIEGSMNWYNKCDNGLIVVRDPEKSSARVISAKVREHGAGKRGQCFFTVDEATGVFTPMAGMVS